MTKYGTIPSVYSIESAVATDGTDWHGASVLPKQSIGGYCLDRSLIVNVGEHWASLTKATLKLLPKPG